MGKNTHCLLRGFFVVNPDGGPTTVPINSRYSLIDSLCSVTFIAKFSEWMAWCDGFGKIDWVRANLDIFFLPTLCDPASRFAFPLSHLLSKDRRESIRNGIQVVFGSGRSDNNRNHRSNSHQSGQRLFPTRAQIDRCSHCLFTIWCYISQKQS